MTFKEFKTTHLRRPKVWLWHTWFRLEMWYAKRFGKTYTEEEFKKELEKWYDS